MQRSVIARSSSWVPYTFDILLTDLPTRNWRWLGGLRVPAVYSSSKVCWEE